MNITQSVTRTVKLNFPYIYFCTYIFVVTLHVIQILRKKWLILGVNTSQI